MVTFSKGVNCQPRALFTFFHLNFIRVQPRKQIISEHKKLKYLL